MLCSNCGHELGDQQQCSHCATSPPAPTVTASTSNSIRTLLLVGEIVVCWIVVAFLSFDRTLRWSGGRFNAESSGYFVGTLITPLLIAAFVVWLINRGRNEKMSTIRKHVVTASLAIVISLVSFAGSVRKTASAGASAKQELADLLRQAAGKKPKIADAHWWDAPSRDFFQDIIEMNQQYISEVRALDNSAIKNLYSADSYAGKTHMEKVLVQLQAAAAVDAKYSSVDPIFKKMRDRVAATDAPEREKANFLEGLNGSFTKALEPRNNLLRVEKECMDASVDLYEFMVANTNHYSIRGAKLYFDSTQLSDEFVKRQSKAIALHKDLMKTKAAFENNRANNLNQMGISPSELTPSQLGKMR
jgi:hypothetical protein